MPRKLFVFLSLALLVPVGIAFGRASVILDFLRTSSLVLPVLTDPVVYSSIPNAPENYIVQANQVGVIAPDPGEEGHRAAVRFKPKAPFALKSIRWYDANAVTSLGKHCSATVSHDVEVYVIPDAAPPSNPTPIASWVVPGVTSSNGSVLRHIVVAEDVYVPAGWSLYVVFELPGNANTALACLTSWKNAPFDAEEAEFWSNAVSPPYDWKGLDQGFNLNYKPFVTVEGYEYLISI